MNSNKKLKIGVVGCGHLGRFHAKMHTMIDNSMLIGVYDADSKKSKKVAGGFETKQFNSLDELIDATDALIIVTSTPAHYKVAKKCLLNKKHVFIEKPITETVKQAEELIQLAKDNHLKLQIGHIERYNPAFFAIKDIKLDPKFIESHRLAMFNPRGSDVAVVLDLMIHDIDIILHLIKSPVKDIRASGVNVVSNNLDIANVRIEFENGTSANITASRISLKKMRKLRIFQKDSYISLDFDKGAADIFRLTDANDVSISGLTVGNIEDTGKKIVYSSLSKIERNALLEENRDFVNSVLNDTPVSISGEDGLRALEVAITIINKINSQLKIVNMK